MRQLVILVIGLVVGASSAFMAARALTQRDAYPRGVMAVLQHHLAQERSVLRAGKACTSSGGFARIAGLSGDIVVSNADLAQRDGHFADVARTLEQKATAAAAAPPAATCAEFGERVRSVAEVCDDCHRDYR